MISFLYIGITQEDIDEKRRVPEREMLAAMERLVKTSGDLNQLDSQGAAPVSFLEPSPSCFT